MVAPCPSCGRDTQLDDSNGPRWAKCKCGFTAMGPLYVGSLWGMDAYADPRLDPERWMVVNVAGLGDSVPGPGRLSTAEDLRKAHAYLQAKYEEGPR